MDTFAGRFAVVTGGGSGMGRELVIQLAAEGCAVAVCDVREDTAEETAALARAGAPDGTTVTAHACDVADEAQVARFRDEALAAHGAGHVDLVFSNAGLGGGGSFINDPREMWERVFAVDFWGVYHCARVFLPLLMRGPEGVLVNTSSVNGFWASLGAGVPHTAYSTAKFAVKGFSEALIEDLRISAPNVRVALVMPGHVATNIVGNSMMAFGVPRRTPRKRTRASSTARRCPRRARRRSSWTACAPGPGGSWSARTRTASTSTSARVPRTPTTTRSWPRRRAVAASEDLSRAAAEWFSDVDLPRAPGARDE